MRTDEEKILRLLSDPKTRRTGFAQLVDAYGQSLYWKVRHIVLSHEDANDVVQEAFIKAWTNLDSFRGQSQLSTWLYRIAVNEALDFLRRQKNREAISADEAEGVGRKLVADEYFDGDETELKLQQAIATLPDVQRTVFTLRYYNEMKYSEISQMLGTSEGALKASYHLAVNKIKEFFNSHD